MQPEEKSDIDLEQESFRDSDFEYESFAENEEDAKTSLADFSDLFILPTDWTVSTVRNEISNQIDLNPEFQRRGVWNNTSKSRFIESLILGIPIPQILLAERLEEKNTYLVLDGKQRLLTIRQFFEETFDDGRPFRLNGLETLNELEGLTWSEIKKDNTISRALETSTIRTIVLKNWKSDNVLYEIFYRLNSGSVKLSPMELRMALYPGEFLKYIIIWTEKLRPLHTLLKLKNPDKRMADVELTVRHLAFADTPEKYRGNLKKFLDDYCSEQNRIFDQKIINKKLEVFEDSIVAAIKVFGPRNVCRKWVADDEQFDTRFNRAIFDVQIACLANQKIRAWALENPSKFSKAFQELCEEDSSFIASVESTTKSIPAAKKRFQAWFSKLSKVSGIQLKIPNIANELSNQ